ncbi:MAG: hypothetical protein ACK5YA_00105, partial [bacterium]
NSNTNNNKTQIKILGFPPHSVFSICEILKKLGNITSYCYKNDSNYIIIQYSTQLEAQKAYNFINNNNSIIKAFYDTEDYYMKPFNSNLSERDLEYLFNSVSIENSNYMLQGNNRVKVPKKDFIFKFLMNFSTFIVFLVLIFLMNKAF